MAVKAACDTIRDRIAEFLAGDHQADPARSALPRGTCMSAARRSPLPRRCSAPTGRVSLSATGFYKTPDIEWDRIAGRGRPFFYFAMASPAARW